MITSLRLVRAAGFLELGLIGNNPMMLKSTRTPTFDPNGNLESIVGFAVDEGEWWADLRQGLDWYLADSNTRQIGPGLYLLRQEPESPSEVSEMFKGVFRANQSSVLSPDAKHLAFSTVIREATKLH